MEKLKTNELSLGLDQTFRNDLVDNFEKIQNGVDGQSDAINKQITDFTNLLGDQLHGLIDSEPVNTNPDTVISTTKYLDQDWLKITSTANTPYRGLAFEINNPDKILAMTTYPVKINFNIQSSIDQSLGLDVHFYDSNGKAVNNVVNIDNIALKASETLNYQKEFLLDSDNIKGVSKVSLFLYTSGTNNLGTILINNYIAVLEYNTNETLNQLPELIDGQPTPSNDTVISNTEYLDQNWMKMTSTANTLYRGLSLWINNPDNILAMANYPVKINFNIQSSIDQSLRLDIHFYDINGQNMNNALNIDNIALKASKILNYQKEFSLDFNHLKDVKRVALFLYTTGTNDLGTVLVNNYSAVLEYNTNEKLNQLSGLIDGQPSPSNSDTVISITNYLDQEWLKITSTANTLYRGLSLWINNPDKISAMGTYPVKVNFNIQSSIDQSLRLDIHFYDNKGLNNTINIDTITLKASEILNYQKEFSLDSSNIKDVSRVALFLYTTGTNDLGTILINNYSAVLEYNTNETLNQLPELINGRLTPSNNTVISTTEYLDQNWLKMTSTTNTPYRGLNLWIDNPDNVLAMANYPVKFNFNIQSSIDQSLGLGIHFYDVNGKDMNNSIGIDNIALKASEILNYQKEFSLDSNHIKGVNKISLFLFTPGTNDLGTILINDYSAVLEYNTNETSNTTPSAPTTSYDYNQLPEVYLDGPTAGMSGTNYVKMQFKFKDNGREVDGFASTKWQGDSSLVWDKKAYRIKTFEDQSLTQKMKFKPSPLWSADNKYNLKAYYTDAILCRDVVNANIGIDLWATQKNMPDDLAETNDFGFIDGFPVKVFINKAFAGIYSFNTTKGDYGKNAKAVISGEKYTDTTQFIALQPGGVKLDGSDFEMISPDNPTDEIKQAVNSLITFVSTSSDDDFKAQLGTHIDLESLIDYFIFLNMIENGDAAGKNQTLITWDLQKWYFHPYDLDTTYGLGYTGDISDPSNGLSGLNSHLFKRLNSLFADEIKSRYKELRTWLTPVYVLKMYRDHINLIGESNYEDEFKLWNNPNLDKNNYNFIKIHVYKQFKLLDSLWLQ
ncbi:CotH kinase family protein [Lactiplantibacillus argentoratensis]|uniref:CotH kinase family protein n=1 Tax=Lactiplantibacillus argentoratensis TaxID=271881 RepID=UPI001C0FD045|nr:CotH kinase family protein [Lactiplantibacillus argentoratensis]MBU5277858.1 CotH kinase family protein [Lactiplantibacillus argentoratensis]